VMMEMMISGGGAVMAEAMDDFVVMAGAGT
jgi:hypothetical protein